jgi:anthranilate phosphoribosyltransferase
MSKTEWLMFAPISATNPKADTPLYRFLVRLMRGENLSMDEATEFFRALTDANANTAQIAGALVALTTKGETSEELAGMTRVMREKAVKVKTRQSNIVDMAGTGSSSAKTFNVSTAAAFVAAGAGLHVAKHASRAVVSRTGSADALGKLGVKVAVEPTITQACLNGAGICFLFAPNFHPYLRRVGDVRRNLGIRTCLNLLGVLSNPADVERHLIGVWHPSLLEPLAEAVALLETERTWIVYGADGLDEVTLSNETFVAEITGKKIKKFKLSPEDFGIQRAGIEHLKTETPEQSAKIIREVLDGKRRDEARSLVVLNAAAALIVGGIAKQPMQAARLAEQSIDSGSAKIKLERLMQTTNKSKS